MGVVKLLSQIEKQHLAEIDRQAQRIQWLEENKSALGEYNRRIESRGKSNDVPAAVLMAQFDGYF